MLKDVFVDIVGLEDYAEDSQFKTVWIWGVVEHSFQKF